MPDSPFASRAELVDLLTRFAQVNIAVVGDFFLDRYLVIDPALDEPSIETGLNARQVVDVRNSPGAAGTVVNNMSSLGFGGLHIVGFVGDDGYGLELRRELERRGARTQHLITSPDRFTPTYTKPMVRQARGERELERLDVINRSPTPAVLEDRLISSLSAVSNEVDAVVVLDQLVHPENGAVTERVRAAVCQLASHRPETIFFADSRASIGKFRNVIIKPNRDEALAAVGVDDQSDSSVRKAAQRLFEETARPVLITCGESGILVTEADGQKLVPGFRVAGPIDVTGAGDSATAGIVLSLAAGASLTHAVLVGNLVASLTVEQLGTTGVATTDQVLSRYDEWVSR